ncbi:kinase-like protein [Atractiella rhizophila]|nr:kinase-like protein [Atractiella rhizophila]
MSLDRYREYKEGYFLATYMEIVAAELAERLGLKMVQNLFFLSDKQWTFHLLPVVENNEHGQIARYRFCPEFRVGEIPRFIVEVQSVAESKQEKEEDQARMLLEGATVVRIAQYAINQSEKESWPFVIICCYVDRDLTVRRYLMCSEDIKNPSGKVVYRRDDYSLLTKDGAFTFPLELYNLTAEGLKLSAQKSAKGAKILKIKKIASPVTMEPQKTERSRTDGSDAGYSLALPQPQGLKRWTTSSLSSLSSSLVAEVCRGGQRFIVKVVEDHEEVAIHRSLAQIDDSRNHTIKIIDLLECEDDLLLILPLGVPLRDLEGHLDPALAIRLCEQLIEGVAFIHSHDFAHLDLKPENFVVIGDTLQIIDFGLSGNETWVAPEVGESGGPKRTFHPIPADLWATGRIILRFFSPYLPENHKLLKLATQLTLPDPNSRPALR